MTWQDDAPTSASCFATISECWSPPAAGISRSTSRYSQCLMRTRWRRPSMPSISPLEDIPEEVHASAHICQGNYAVGKEYDGQIGHRYFDTGRYKAELVCRIQCSSYLIEHDMTPHYQGLLARQSARHRSRRCAGSQDRECGNDRRADPGAWMARARTDHPHELVRIQSSFPPGRLRQVEGDGRKQNECWAGNPRRRIRAGWHQRQ